MPTRREINELYSAANELKRVKKERDALKAELETANHLLSMRLTNSGSDAVIAELREKLAEQQTIIKTLNERAGCDTTLDHIRALDDMQAVADAHAHRLALYLELVCSDYGGKFWDMAMSVLGEYRADMNRIHERESPTFMGEPVLPKGVKNES